MEGEKIYHKCAIGSCSSGAPIINLQKFKAIGIHQSRDKLVPLNIGILLKDCIKDFKKLILKRKKQSQVLMMKNLKEILNKIKVEKKEL